MLELVMKTSRHLIAQLAALAIALTGVSGCGSDDSVTGDGPKQSEDPVQGSGSKSDAGVKRDGGKPPASSGGSSGSGSSGSSSGGNASGNDDPNACEKLQLPANPNSPQILIVLDRSGSMIGVGGGGGVGKNRWEPSVSAVKKLTASLTGTVEFGLMLFPSPGNADGGGFGGFLTGIAGGGGPGCAAGVVNVPVALNTAGEISSMLDMSGPDVGSTPTAASLLAAKEALSGGCSDCVAKPKYVLLVTDGQPTCGADGGPGDVDATNAAIDELSKAEIKTYVIGYDTLPGTPEGDAMQSFAEHGGTEKYFPVEDETSLVAELTRIASALVPCEFELKDEITDPSYVRVEIDGKTYNFGSDWQVDGKKIVLDPMGGACPLLRDAQVHFLNITRECEVVLGI
jgi:hypothetical protein